MYVTYTRSMSLQGQGLDEVSTVVRVDIYSYNEKEVTHYRSHNYALSLSQVLLKYCWVLLLCILCLLILQSYLFNSTQLFWYSKIWSLPYLLYDEMWVVAQHSSTHLEFKSHCYRFLNLGQYLGTRVGARPPSSCKEEKYSYITSYSKHPAGAANIWARLADGT